MSALSERKRIVFGDGTMDTKLFFVGKLQGQKKMTGCSLVWKSRTTSDQDIRGRRIDRKEIFITNVVKCRPPGNRVPSIEEMLACEDFLRSQIALVNPSIMFALGNTDQVDPENHRKHLQDTWQVVRLERIKVMPMFHPSFLLRNQSKKKGSPRELTWIDIQEVRNRWMENR